MSEFTLKTPTQEPDLATAMQVIYQWNYDPEVAELRNLYVKAAEAQWIGEKQLDWSRPIDLVKFSTTPLGAGVPIERTSYWRSLCEETRAEARARHRACTRGSVTSAEPGLRPRLGLPRSRGPRAEAHVPALLADSSGRPDRVASRDDA